jgi:hypothetical protein
MNIFPTAYNAAATRTFAVNLPPPLVTQRVEQSPKQSNPVVLTGGPASSPNPEPTSYSLANSGGLNGTSGTTVNLTA